MRQSIWNVTGGVLLAALMMAAPASAQQFGARGGASIDPDGAYVGAHIETGPLTDRLYFRPNLEAGFGAITMASVNFEFVYKFPRRSDWGMYVGAGPGVHFYNRNRGSSTDGGLNILIGVEQRSGLFFEFKVGAFGSPDAKFGIGYAFR